MPTLNEINYKKPDGMNLPEGARNGGNCGVTAVAIAANVSFDQAWDLFKQHCPRIKDNKRWTGGTYDRERNTVMKKLGIKYANVPSKTFLNSNRLPTLKRFVEWNTKKGALYIVTTTHHVQVVKDGWVIDQSGAREIENYWGRNKIVDRVEIITPKKKAASKSSVYAGANLLATFADDDGFKRNPRRKGTRGWHSFEIILKNPGIVYEQYIAKGGRRQDLDWDWAKGNVVVDFKNNPIRVKLNG